MNWKNSFHPYAAITIFFWSLAYVLTRIELQYFSPFSLGFLRYFIASCTLFMFAFLAKLELPEKKDFPWFLASGAAGFFFYMIFFNKGCQTVPASTSSVIIATVPVLTAVFARFVYSEKLNFYQWIAILIEFVGVCILTLMKGVFSINKGIFWLLLAAVSLSLYNLMQRKLTKSYSALQITAFSIFSGTVMLSVFSFEALREVQEASVMILIELMILGVFSSAVAYAAWSQAFAKAKQTSSVSNYMFATPVLASLMGFVITGEKPDLPTTVGGAVILFGILVFYRAENFTLQKYHRGNKN